MTKQDLKIIFFGTSEFAVESLKELHTNGYNVVSVVTIPDRIGGRGHKVLQSPIKKYSEENNLNLLQPEDLKSSDFIDKLRSLQADLFIVVAFRILPKVVWSMPRLGTFNLHASALPKYRGAAPINWAIINGDMVTGVTTFFLNDGVDTGPVILQSINYIRSNDNFGSLHDRLKKIGAELVVKSVDKIIKDKNPILFYQKEIIHEGSLFNPCPAPKITKEICHIDWSKSAEGVHNLIRGLSPSPGAWTNFELPNGKILDIKIFETKVSTDTDLPPGTIKSTKNKLYIACSGKFLKIISLQQAGKRNMTSSEFLRGISLENSKAI